MLSSDIVRRFLSVSVVDGGKGNAQRHELEHGKGRWKSEGAGWPLELLLGTTCSELAIEHLRNPFGILSS